MNKIYIINNTINIEIILNFGNNTFEYDSIKYVFNFIENNELLIEWSDFNEIFYTDDSYIYVSNLTMKKDFKKIFLVHNEWNDQAIINFEKMTLERIEFKNEFGPIRIDDNNLYINWINWGEEKYIKRDEYTYVQEEYIYEKELSVINDIPIYIFIHICILEDWREIFWDQINTIKESGLYEIVEKINLGIVGNIENLRDDIFNDNKFNILYIDSRVTLYESHTINFIKSFCDNIDKEVYILYIHTKGTRNAGNKEVTKSWRNMMEYFLINKYNDCLKYLDIFDTLGNNIINTYCFDKNEIAINKDHTFHYSGNFWWSKKSYIDKLNYIELDLTKKSINTRYRAENWILSNYPNMKIGSLFQDCTNIHPYHRYVFDYYKDMKIIIKNYNYSI